MKFKVALKVRQPLKKFRIPTSRQRISYFMEDAFESLYIAQKTETEKII